MNKEKYYEEFNNDTKEFTTLYFFKWKRRGEAINPYFPASDFELQDGNYCIFYNEETSCCMIHNIKPQTAKDYYCVSDTNPSVYDQVKEWKNNEIGAFLNFIRNMYSIETLQL